MPLIEHGPAPDRGKLPAALKESWEWVIITSPEAAAVLLEARKQHPKPPARLIKSLSYLHIPLKSVVRPRSLPQGWREAGCPPVRVASVGTGTTRVLDGGGVRPLFQPSKANAETLAGVPQRLSVSPCRSYVVHSSAVSAPEIHDGLLISSFRLRQPSSRAPPAG